MGKDGVWGSLFERLANVRAAWPARGWSWDSKLDCVTSSFSAQFEEAARKAAHIALPTIWTPSSLGSAPPRLRELADRSGGVRAAQLILTDDPHGNYLAFGLWWPWGNGQTISLRIGLDETEASSVDYQRLRDAFGAET